MTDPTTLERLREIRQHFERKPIQDHLAERQMVGVLFDRIGELERENAALREAGRALLRLIDNDEGVAFTNMVRLLERSADQ